MKKKINALQIINILLALIIIIGVVIILMKLHTRSVYAQDLQKINIDDKGSTVIYNCKKCTVCIDSIDYTENSIEITLKNKDEANNTNIQINKLLGDSAEYNADTLISAAPGKEKTDKIVIDSKSFKLEDISKMYFNIEISNNKDKFNIDTNIKFDGRN